MEVAGAETKRDTRMEVGDDGVAVITIFNTPLNCFTFDMFVSLKESYEQAMARDDVRAIVITGEGRHFSGGFDANEFNSIRVGKIDLPKPGYLIDVMTDILEASKKPAVAAIDGLCVGGGLEIAMTCRGRISTATARIGLPELMIGLIPGLGGTQRLRRLVGLDKALDMMLSSELVPGEEAYELGLVDAVVASPDELIKTARSWALDIAESRKPWTKALCRTDKLEPVDKAKDMLQSARAQVQTPAAIACIDAVTTGVVSGHLAGLWKEVDSFVELVFSDGFKNLPNGILAEKYQLF